MSEALDGPPVLEPAAHPEGAWLIPLEVVLALPTSSVMRGVIRKRMDRQDWPYPDALVFVRGKRFFADVRFHGGGRPSLTFALDVWATENGLAHGAA